MRLVKFTSLSLRNFLSYGNNTTVIQLDRSGTTLILGEDLDHTANGQGANGVGKASYVDAPIKTPNGWIRMGDIKVGQQLQMPDGSTAPVTGVFPQGKQPLYEVAFADGRSTKVTKEHLWTVFSHRWGRQGTHGTKTVTTEDLIQYLNDSEERNFKPWYNNIFVPTITHPDVPDAELPINPYLLGVLLGDGCISNKTINIASGDNSLIKECSRILENDHEQQLKYYHPKTNNGCSWVVSSATKNAVIDNSIRYNLQQLNLYGCKSDTKFIPPEYLEGTSKQQKIDLLAGLLDTNGTVNKTENVSFCSISEQLAKDVQYLVRSLGGKATITTRNPFYTNKDGRKIQGQLAYDVSIQYSNPRELFHLERKRELLSEGETQYTNEGLRIISIKQVEDGEAQCIMVDHPDHLYITDNFITTHNTVIINALAFAVYGKPVSDISLDNLVNNINKKNMEVSVDFSKNGNEYRIVRARKMKAGAAGNYVLFYENGKEITRDSTANTNRAIESIIGIPYELFVRIVVFSATHPPFLDLPVKSHYGASQTGIIEELFDLTTLTEKANTLKDQIKESELDLNTRRTKIDLLEKELIRHHEQLKSAKVRVVNWEKQNSDTIDSMKEQLEQIKNVDFETQRSLHDELNNLDDQLKTAMTSQRELETAIKKYTKSKTSAEKDLVHLRDDQCPYCLQKYQNAAMKITECEQVLTECESEIEKLSVELDKVDDTMKSLTRKYKETKGKITVHNIEELLEIRSQSSNISDRIDELENAVNPFVEPLDELEEIKLEEIDYTEINELQKTIDHQKFLLKLLTKKDSFVRKNLLNKNLPFLNSRLQGYLAELGLPHRVEFTHELTAEISQFGRTLDFGNLSNGQRARVNFALSFAFRDVLEKLHTPINVCILDEVLDVGLDTVGIQSAAKMLKRKARSENLSLYIISHRDEIDNAFDQNMVVQLSKGFSYIR